MGSEKIHIKSERLSQSLLNLLRCKGGSAVCGLAEQELQTSLIETGDSDGWGPFLSLEGGLSSVIDHLFADASDSDGDPDEVIREIQRLIEHAVDGNGSLELAARFLRIRADLPKHLQPSADGLLINGNTEALGSLIELSHAFRQYPADDEIRGHWREAAISGALSSEESSEIPKRVGEVTDFLVGELRKFNHTATMTSELVQQRFGFVFESKDMQDRSSQLLAAFRHGATMTGEHLAPFWNRLESEEIPRRFKRIGEWLTEQNQSNYDGAVLTPALIDHLSRPDDIETLLSELDECVKRTRRGEFEFGNTIQRDLEFRRFASVYSNVVLDSVPFDEMYKEFLGLKEFSPTADDEEFRLDDVHAREARRAGYEAARFLEFIKEFRAASRRPIVVVGNDRYGRQWVVEPIQESLAKEGCTIRYYRIASHKNFRFRTYPVFDRDFIRMLCEESPHIVIVDGSSKRGRHRMRYTRASLSYANWFIAFNELRTGGGSAGYRSECCVPPGHYEELLRWHEFVAVRRQLKGWIDPGSTYKIKLWTPEQSDFAQLGDVLVRTQLPELDDSAPMAILANSIVYETDDGRLPEELRDSTPYYFDGPERFARQPNRHDAMGHPIEQISYGFGPYGFEPRIVGPTTIDYVAAVQSLIRREVAQIHTVTD
jgi:hypothetical protein